MKVLITGAAGVVAGHLVERLRAERIDGEIYGLDRPQGGAPSTSGLTLLEADLNDAEALEPVLDVVEPDYIVHLAGQSSVHHSWLDPGGTLRTNVLGIVHLLEAVRRRRLCPGVLVVGSAEEYGAVGTGDLPITERAPLHPTSPYAVSKAAQGLLALQYGDTGMRIVCTRTFPHTGPGRSETFAESSFARQIAEIEAGLREPVLQVGNLDAVRDYTDVRDVVRAYWLLVERGRPGETYNVCSGRGRAIRELLDILLAASSARIEVRVDPKRLRPADVPALVGDCSKLHAVTGWEPRIPLERTLADLLDDWRRRTRAG